MGSAKIVILSHVLESFVSSSNISLKFKIKSNIQ